MIPRELTFFVDGIEHARLNLEESRELRFHASAAAQLLEIWTQDERGPLLLATHMMTDADTAHVEAGFALPLNGGTSVSVVLKKAADNTNPWNVFVSLKDVHHRPLASSIPNWLVCTPAFPAFAGIAVLFIALLLVSTDLWRTLERERTRNSVLDAELARERAAQTSSHAAEIQTIVKYRLTPDDLVTRGNSDIQEHAVAVPSVPTVIELVLPVTGIHGWYRIVLTPFAGGNRLLEETLSADVRGAEAAVTCSVPSDLLAPDRYYRVELLDPAFHYVRTFTFYTAPSRR